MAGFELANVGRTDMGENIKLKIAQNARSMVFTPSLVTGMPFTSNGFESICPPNSRPELLSVRILGRCLPLTAFLLHRALLFLEQASQSAKHQKRDDPLFYLRGVGISCAII